MNRKVLLLGSSGKMGTALKGALEHDYIIIGKNSKDFDALDFPQVHNLIEGNKADIVINTVALLGIGPCEKEPEKAFRLNTLYPKFLAELSKEKNFLLIHFSTDAVFNDAKGDFYIESDSPCPLNIYGFTKYGGDCFIQTLADQNYIFRVSVLFGETSRNTQFVEKMLQRVREGQRILKVSDDIFSSPTYSKDVAGEAKRIIESKYPYGIYHIANEGRASLYELMKEVIDSLGFSVKVEKASYRDFPFAGKKNTCTPLKSEKISLLRPWKDAVKEYCFNLKKGK